MGQLIERQQPTLFGGVSKQPAHVRKPNQFEESTNALSSVVSGGFEKRPCAQMVAKITGLDTSVDYAVFEIDRDATEQHMVCIDGAGNLFVIDTIAGSLETVNIGDTEKYFLVEAVNVDATGVMDTSSLSVSQADGWDASDRYRIYHGDTQFDWEFISSDASMQFDIQGSADGTTWNDIASNKTGATGSFSTTVDAAATGDHNYIRINVDVAAGSAADTFTLKATYKDKTYLALFATGPEDFSMVSVADYNFILNRNVTARLAEVQSGTVTDVARATTVGTPPAGIPAPSGSGDIYKIVKDSDDFSTFFVKDDTTDDVYVETVDPNDYNKFDASSLPHLLVRESDGTFTFKAGTYADRAAGDSTLLEAPSFIDRTISDVTFFRNRLGLIADENIFLSRSANALNMWAEKAVDTLDTDPVDRAATTTDVNILQWASVYRKILFVTSLRAQFEMTSESSFTPDTAQFDQSTRYPASAVAKPKPMNDVLYFPSEGPEYALLYEYYFDDTSLANTATDVTKHIPDYLPNSILKIVTDAVSGTVFVLTTGEQNSVFVYRTFFDGTEKILSSWGKWTFGASEATALIHGIAVFTGFLVMLIEREDGFYIEQVSVEREGADATMGYIPLIDQREIVTGTYDSTNDVTVWVPTWTHDDDAEVVLGPLFSGDDPGRRLTVVYPSEYTLTLASVAAGETIKIDDGTTELTFTAHATTTTVADREFDISGNDTADAGELVTCINNATYGHGTISATDNEDGTVTLLADDEFDVSIVAPTGTAVTNATITVAEVDQRIAARGQHDDSTAYVGRAYTMTQEWSKFFLHDQDGPAIINGRLQVRDLTLQYQDTGYFQVVVTPRLRTADTYTFTGRIVGDDANVIGLAAIDPLGSFTSLVGSDGSTVKVEVKNDTPFPSVITSAAWRGFFNEISRQG